MLFCHLFIGAKELKRVNERYLYIQQQIKLKGLLKLYRHDFFSVVRRGKTVFCFGKERSENRPDSRMKIAVIWQEFLSSYLKLFC